ncbi:MAG: hypothetical protein P9M00_10625 [Candidatus Tritonobacter lacicola]|nr:hypothetical protein [Candidatus Tritonobacter lacicola]
MKTINAERLKLVRTLGERGIGYVDKIETMGMMEIMKILWRGFASALPGVEGRLPPRIRGITL